MKIDDIYNRLNSLLNNGGISCDEITEKAELKAYLVGFNFVLKMIEETENDLFIDSATDFALPIYLDVINEKRAETLEKTKENIIKAYSANNGIIDKKEFINAIMGLTENSTVENSFEVETNNGIFVINNPKKLTKNLLEKLSTFFRDYAAAFLKIKLSGNGANFEKWSEFKMQWHDIDKYQLPFSIYETVK